MTRSRACTTRRHRWSGRRWKASSNHFRRFPLYLAPGNHDIWSEVSERLFRQHAGHPPHYSFDRGPMHVTILDNSRSEDLASEELTFLEEDLKAHESQPVEMILSHRPSWLVSVALANTSFPLHRIAHRYGVIAGHVHQLLRFSLEGIDYISMPSAGGHLRPAEATYEDGWFFGHALATVRAAEVQFQFEELKPPLGLFRCRTSGECWGCCKKPLPQRSEGLLGSVPAIAP